MDQTDTGNSRFTRVVTYRVFVKRYGYGNKWDEWYRQPYTDKAKAMAVVANLLEEGWTVKVKREVELERK